MAYEEHDAWKCPKHPSRRHRTGICPTCLRDRLISLCPNCAHSLPCPNCSFSSSSSSSSSTTTTNSFARFSIDSQSVGAIGRVSALIDSEPAFRRSRSVAIAPAFLSSRFAGENGKQSRRNKSSSFWSVFGIFKKSEDEEMGDDRLTRSRSVSVWRSSSSSSGSGRPAAKSNKGWYFPSPIKAFRHSRPTRSPLYRG